MRYIIFYFTFISYSFFAQQQARGVVIRTDDAEKTVEGETYALIAGVSKYKSTKIPQLSFADADAIAFQKYLLTNGAKDENIYTLINEQATNATFWTILDLIREKATKGDVVYIYFSGHGDVETNTIVKDAYLLPYDSPPSVYPMGAIGISYLKSWLATFASNGVQTIFIADACRSGNLIGGREGMEAAANILKESWQEEIKMVSCQPGELSLESEKWGGGRGLFSYELINALSGKADKNNDNQVSLRELKLYLMEKVPEQAGKNPQNPEISGNNEKIISKSNPQIYALNQEIRSDNINPNKIDEYAKGNQYAVSQPNAHPNAQTIINKGTKEEQTKDTTALRHYNTCIDLINKNKIVSENSPSAYQSYLDIPNNEDSKQLKQFAKSALVDKMMNDVQILISDILGNNLQARGKINLTQICFEAMALRILLGDQKLKEMGVIAKILFAESCLTFSEGPNSKWTMPSSLGIAKLDSALQYDKGALYVHMLKGIIYRYQLNKKNLAYKSLQIAVEANPNFDLAQEVFSNLLIESKSYDSLLIYGNRMRPSILKDSRLYIAYKKLNFSDSVEIYKTKLLGHSYKPYDKKQELENTKFLGDALMRAKETELAREFLIKNVSALNELIGTDTTIDFFHDISYAYYLIACSYSYEQNDKLALEYIEKALKAGYGVNGLMEIYEDPELEYLRKNKKFKKLLKKEQKKIEEMKKK
jgi:co-chaperonin GroES (HSP10)